MRDAVCIAVAVCQYLIVYLVCVCFMLFISVDIFGADTSSFAELTDEGRGGSDAKDAIRGATIIIIIMLMMIIWC